MKAGAGELIAVYDDPQIKEVDTGTAVITLRMGYTLDRTFFLDPIIAAPVSFVLTQANRGRRLSVKFSIDASDPANVITLPANFVMSSGQFDNATKIWTPIPGDTGAYTLTAWFDGVNWNATIIGPDNT